MYDGGLSTNELDTRESLPCTGASLYTCEPIEPEALHT